MTSNPLRTIKLLHTVVWAVFASAIVALPIAGWLRRLDWVAVLTVIVSVEIAVLVANGWRCPLTAVAARHTEDRKANFDIYLPLWLATYNKPIFGGLFLAGLLLAVGRALQP